MSLFSLVDNQQPLRVYWFTYCRLDTLSYSYSRAQQPLLSCQPKGCRSDSSRKEVPSDQGLDPIVNSIKSCHVFIAEIRRVFCAERQLQ